MTERDTCPHCGATMAEYHHGLSRPLVQGLHILGRNGGGPINLKYLVPNLTRNQWDNFQKLRYFDLVERVDVDGRRRKGVWRITERGRAFLDGRITVPSRVRTYRGERVGWEGESVYVHEAFGGYQLWEVWANEATPPGDRP